MNDLYARALARLNKLPWLCDTTPMLKLLRALLVERREKTIPAREDADAALREFVESQTYNLT